MHRAFARPSDFSPLRRALPISRQSPPAPRRRSRTCLHYEFHTRALDYITNFIVTTLTTLRMSVSFVSVVSTLRTDLTHGYVSAMPRWAAFVCPLIGSLIGNAEEPSS